MPIYEYQCQKCQKIVDVLQKVSDPAPEKCEACGEVGAMSRQVSRTSFVLKGGGWYSDLYATPKKDKGTGGGDGGGSSSSSGGSGGAGASSSSGPSTGSTTGGGSSSSSSSKSAATA